MARHFDVRVKNREELVKAGTTKKDRQTRRIVIHALETALDAVNPEKLLRRQVKYRHNRISVAGCNLHLPVKGKVILIAAGKASIPLTLATQQILGRSIH